MKYTIRWGGEELLGPIIPIPRLTRDQTSAQEQERLDEQQHTLVDIPEEAKSNPPPPPLRITQSPLTNISP